MDPVEALNRIGYLLEKAREPRYRVQAFRKAAVTIEQLPAGELEARIKAHTLEKLAGIGKVTAEVITQAAAGDEPEYLRNLEANVEIVEHSALRKLLKGDLHTHSDWSDGGSPIRTMGLAARGLGHDYIALTDHSPRLTIANGLSPERLREQLDLLEEINAELAPFRILSGIEVDILDDGSLDQQPELLDRLDIVVASVHSKLRMEPVGMTARMLGAIRNPNTSILGHCTGRIVVGRGRPQSQFDSAAVFAECASRGVAVEINSRPERLDPPMRLLSEAVGAGCLFSIDTDAHAPGQLDWQENGCERAEAAAVDPEQIVNTWSMSKLLEWSRRNR